MATETVWSVWCEPAPGNDEGVAGWIDADDRRQLAPMTEKQACAKALEMARHNRQWTYEARVRA